MISTAPPKGCCELCWKRLDQRGPYCTTCEKDYSFLTDHLESQLPDVLLGLKGLREKTGEPKLDVLGYPDSQEPILKPYKASWRHVFFPQRLPLTVQPAPKVAQQVAYRTVKDLMFRFGLLDPSQQYQVCVKQFTNQGENEEGSVINYFQARLQSEWGLIALYTKGETVSSLCVGWPEPYRDGYWVSASELMLPLDKAITKAKQLLQEKKGRMERTTSLYKGLPVYRLTPAQIDDFGTITIRTSLKSWEIGFPKHRFTIDIKKDGSSVTTL